MPRYRPIPPPEPSELAVVPLHVLVRDWPELDPLLRGAGVELEVAGHLRLGEVLGSASPSPHPPAGVGAGRGDVEPGVAEVMDQMVAATRWRSDPPAPS